MELLVNHTTGTSGRSSDMGILLTLFDVLSNYAWTVPVAIGVPGNAMSLIVANRRRNRKLSPCVYMTAMAVADNVLLLEIAWFYTLFYPGALDGIIKDPGLASKFHIYFMYTSAAISGFFLAEMSIDRLLAVRMPMAAARLCTTKRAKLTVILTTVIIGGLNLHLFFIYDYVHDPETGVRILLYTISPVLEIMTSLLQIIIGSVFPFLIILLSNIIIIFTLRKAVEDRRNLSSKQTTGEADTKHLTFILIFVSAAYIITAMPYRLTILINHIPAVAAIYDMTDPYWRLVYVVVNWGFINIWFYNNAINYYIYCIGGGRRYRQDSLEVLKHCLYGCRLRTS